MFMPAIGAILNAAGNKDPFFSDVFILMNAENGSNRYENLGTGGAFTNTSTTIDTSSPLTGAASWVFGSGSDIARTMQIPFGTADWCFEDSIYPTTVSTSRIFNKQTSGSDYFVIRIASGKINFICSTGSISLSSTSTISANNRYDIEVFRSGTTIGIGVNGTIEATATISGSLNLTQPSSKWGIGRSALDGSEQFLGKMDNARLTLNHARNTANYTPTFPFPTS